MYPTFRVIHINVNELCASEDRITVQGFLLVFSLRLACIRVNCFYFFLFVCFSTTMLSFPFFPYFMYYIVSIYFFPNLHCRCVKKNNNKSVGLV